MNTSQIQLSCGMDRLFCPGKARRRLTNSPATTPTSRTKNQSAELSAKPAAGHGGAGADDEQDQGEDNQDQTQVAAVHFSGIEAEVADEVFHLIAPYWNRFVF
jgi:hypothetical protein